MLIFSRKHLDSVAALAAMPLAGPISALGGYAETSISGPLLLPVIRATTVRRALRCYRGIS